MFLKKYFGEIIALVIIIVALNFESVGKVFGYFGVYSYIVLFLYLIWILIKNWGNKGKIKF